MQTGLVNSSSIVDSSFFYTAIVNMRCTFPPPFRQQDADRSAGLTDSDILRGDVPCGVSTLKLAEVTKSSVNKICLIKGHHGGKVLPGFGWVPHDVICGYCNHPPSVPSEMNETLPATNYDIAPEN